MVKKIQDPIINDYDNLEGSGQIKGITNKRMNDLSGKEWIRESISVWFQKGLGKNHEHTHIERQHPAPFSYQDIMRFIHFFTKEKETVLDPFCGVASTLKACALTNRTGIGIELSPRWAKLGAKRLQTEIEHDASMHKIIIGDALNILPSIDRRLHGLRHYQPALLEYFGQKTGS